MDKDKILYRIRRRMKENEARNRDFAAYDDIDNMKWNIPWKAQPWVRKRVSSVGHNGLKTVVNLFNTYAPKWDILPRGPADLEKAEELERWLEWEMGQANLLDAQEPFRKMLVSSAKKGVITAQLNYLPYWMPDGEDRKAALMSGSYCIKVIEPDDIHYEIGTYAPRWVAQVSNVTSSYIMDMWEQYEDEGIKAALSKVMEKVRGLDEEERFLYVDYTDKDRRWVFCVHTGKRTTAATADLKLMVGADRIDIVDQPNELPFINWVITEVTGDPLFKSMHYSGSWENQNFFETLSDSSVIRRAYFPLLKHTSANGEPLDVDYTGVEPVIENRPGDQTEVMTPPPLDRGIAELQDRNSVNMAADLGVRGLQQTDVTGNVQFATVNAQIQLGKTVLDPHIKAFERACVQLGRLAFWWVKATGDTVTAYRSKTRNGKQRGEKINVSPKDFDPKTLMIQCELLANTPTDDMQRWNIFSGMKQMGLHIPDAEFVERMEMGDPETLQEKWLEEQAINFAWQLFMQRKQGEMQMQIQMQAQQAQQQAMQAMNQAQGQPPPDEGQAAFAATQGQGFDPSQGGSSPAEAAPQMSQTVMR